jgi:hypothetical protein
MQWNSSGEEMNSNYSPATSCSVQHLALSKTQDLT